MKRQNIILYLFITLGLVALISIYIANKSLNETLKKTEEEKIKLQFQRPPHRIQRLPVAARKKDTPLKEARKQKAILKAEEVDLQPLPEDYVEEKTAEEIQEDILSEEVPEASTPEETDLKTMPSADELNELKSKGIILY